MGYNTSKLENDNNTLVDSFTSLDDFEFERQLGYNTDNSCVYLARSKLSGENYAIKIVGKEKSWRREIRYLKRLQQHPNIIKFFCGRYNSFHGYIFLEYAPYQTLKHLRDQKGYLGESECKNYYKQIVQAVKHCHNNNVLHRDIKPENILMFDKGVVKLADFGYSINPETHVCDEPIGSPYWRSPEMVRWNIHSYPSDIWSLGVMLYELLTDKFPFDDISDKCYDEKLKNVNGLIIKGDYTYPYRPLLTEDVMNLIDNMLVVDINNRYTLDNIIGHPWLNDTPE